MQIVQGCGAVHATVGEVHTFALVPGAGVVPHVDQVVESRSPSLAGSPRKKFTVTIADLQMQGGFKHTTLDWRLDYHNSPLPETLN